MVMVWVGKRHSVSLKGDGSFLIWVHGERGFGRDFVSRRYRSQAGTYRRRDKRSP